MKQLCIAAGGLSLVGVALLVSAGYTTIFMPGRLSAPHKRLKADCSTCHRRWSLSGGGTTGCTSGDCHFPMRQQTLHTKAPQPACTQCHIEHVGAKLTPATVVGDGPCRDCHIAKLKKDHPPKPACHKCHFHHVAPGGCAPAAMRPTAIPMKHYVHLNTMAEILKVRDFESLCPTCHQVRPNNYSFAPFTRQGCNRNNPNCHALKRPEGGKKWKDPLAQKPIKGYTKPKSSNALFMHSRHIQEHKCTECHPDIVTSKRVTHAAIATAEMCARCHKAEAEKH